MTTQEEERVDDDDRSIYFTRNKYKNMFFQPNKYNQTREIGIYTNNINE